MTERRLRFSMRDDLILLREVIAFNPFDNTLRWTNIKHNVNNSTGKDFSLRAIREHAEHLLKLWSKEDKANLRKSGTEEEYLEKEQLLIQIKDLIKNSKIPQKKFILPDKEAKEPSMTQINNTPIIRNIFSETENLNEQLSSQELMNKVETRANCALLTKDRYLEFLKDVKHAKEVQKKVPRDYWLLRHYDVVVINGAEKLIIPMKKTDSETIFYVMEDEIFDVLYDTHVAIGHGGRDRMVQELNRKYKNITRVQIKNFLDNCELCQHKKKSNKKVVVGQSSSFQQLNCESQVDLTDFHSDTDDFLITTEFVKVEVDDEFSQSNKKEPLRDVHSISSSNDMPVSSNETLPTILTPVVTSNVSQPTIISPTIGKKRKYDNNNTDNSNHDKQSKELSIRERELNLEERRVALEERKILLEEEKFKFEKDVKQQYLAIELEERRHQLSMAEKQQIIDTLINRLSHN